MIINWLRQLRKANYNTLNRIEINKRAILHNLNLLQAQQVGSKIIPVLKSNAYGHGLKEVASILNETAIEMVAVDSFPEAQIIYRYFKGKVLIIGEMPAAAYNYLNWHKTEVCVYNSSTLKTLAALNKEINIHLFINTGMNREGIKDLNSFLQANKIVLAKLTITGICSHLYNADSSDADNQKQLDCFLSQLDLLESKYKSLKYVHLSNSAGVFSLHHSRLNACRPGLAIYGINPFAENSAYYQAASDLRPAMSVYSSIVSIQEIKAGENVSYNHGYTAQEQTKIAVIPFGYCEGLDRRLSNLAKFKLGENQVKVAGSICMNMSCLALDNDLSAKIGDEVQLVSANPYEVNSITNIAKLEKTIVYEVMIKFIANIRRIIVDK